MPTSETQNPETPFDPALREQVIERATSLLDELDELAGALHADPETAFDEHRSAARIADLLTRHGADVEVGAYGLPTAFRAGAGTSGPKVAILAEYDALPEIGHACGHNLIAAMSTGAFLVAGICCLRPTTAPLRPVPAPRNSSAPRPRRAVAARNSSCGPAASTTSTPP